MRLTQEQIRLIAQTVSRWAGEGVEVYLFGSRLNDQARGGDVDLLVESDAPLSLIQRAQIKMELESRLVHCAKQNTGPMKATHRH